MNHSPFPIPHSFRFHRDSQEEILRRLREEAFISQGW
jgi:hypothetical protein